MVAALMLSGALAACTADELAMDDEPDTGDSGEQPQSGYCDPVADWPGAWEALEDQVVVLVNQQRSQGAACGSEGSFEPAGPLEAHPALVCAARVHVQDMHERDYFDHVSPDGEQPWDRMARAGYSLVQAGENIALGATTAEGVMQQWMDSDGHCANIMSPGFDHIGIGHQADGRLWTQVFGASR